MPAPRDAGLERWPPQIQEVAPTMYMVWHFVLYDT